MHASRENSTQAHVLAKVDNVRNNIKIFMALNDKNGTRVAREAGMSQNVVNKFLRKETMISLDGFYATAHVLGVPESLLASPQPITPARIRIARALERMTDAQIEAFLEAEARRDS